MKTSYDPWILQVRSKYSWGKKIHAMFAKGPSITEMRKMFGFQCEKLPQCITLPKRAEHVGNKSDSSDFSLLIAGYIFFVSLSLHLRNHLHLGTRASVTSNPIQHFLGDSKPKMNRYQIKPMIPSLSAGYFYNLRRKDLL